MSVAPIAVPTGIDAKAPMLEALLQQRKAFAAELPVSADVRIDRLRRLVDLLIDGKDQFCDAMHADFGSRSRHVSLLTDIVFSVRNARHAIKHTRQWMKPSRRPLDFPLRLLGADARVEYQPKGVVGVMSPWNFPLYLTVTPLAGVLAAGNRALVKPSELTPATSQLFADRVAQHFDPSEVQVFLGGADVGAAFAQLPFDHLVFTGGGGIGRQVMLSAADKLVPITLELGGKSPVIVGRSADIAQAAERIVLGKLLNAGQICLAPDYVLVARERESELLQALIAAAERHYPRFSGNADYVSIINERHHARLLSYLDDARQRGAEVIQTSAANEPPQAHVLPFSIVRNPPAEADILRHEIFGPLLPVIGYTDIDEAIGFINDRDRPLGLYYFSKDATEQRAVLNRIIAGGVTLNDVIFHVMQEDLPLGGIGASGIGRYHGHEGFLEFSHPKAVYKQTRFDIAALLGSKPPYGKKLEQYIAKELRK